MLADLLLGLLLPALLDDLLVDVLLIVTVPAANMKAMFDVTWIRKQYSEKVLTSAFTRQQDKLSPSKLRFLSDKDHLLKV